MIKIKEVLHKCIINSIDEEKREFDWGKFFNSWFREHGQPCFFLFKKHLGVTNLQAVELLSLIRTHSSVNYNIDYKPEIMFHSTEQVKDSLVETINSVLDSKKEFREQAILDFVSEYFEVLSSIVTVDLFYCSAAVAIPPGIKVDLNKVCVDSGYIHSAGRSVYIRNLKKARSHEFNDRLDDYINKYSNFNENERRIPFVVYAHEDFSGYDNTAKDQIKRGIDSTKLYLEKMSMGSFRLTEIVEDLRKTRSHVFDIPTPGSYKDRHNFYPEKTLWLISERSLSRTNPTNLGRERFYICYEQTVKNESPFYYFDEDKPAWKSHTTLPHSLTAALINITRPIRGDAVYCDPFGGTGTTWLEAKRIDLTTKVYSSDISPIGKLMVEDNLKFFKLTTDQIDVIRNTLSDLKTNHLRSRVNRHEDQGQNEIQFEGFSSDSSELKYHKALSYIKELESEQPNEEQEYTFTHDFVERISSEIFIVRVMFYIGLRAKFRFLGGYKRNSTEFSKAFIDSLSQLLNEIELLYETRLEIEAISEVMDDGKYYQVRGKYSPKVISPIFSDTSGIENEINDFVFIKDARELEPSSIDVIICDPPYGFNTTEDRSELISLYSMFLENAIKAIKKNGHLIICLPAESYTGRDLPYCTRADLVINQVLSKAKKLGREVYTPGSSVPTKGILPPYYWEAERALRREILHFRLI
ncbi:TRM11 family methyltransferase [Vibrio astriarenae]|uniref:hypothetical protein n=1 Tax=Vibrio astriarenae TaxID=1481923 RepID=UPI003736997F